MAPKQRLDLVLVERGLVASRQQAQQWIRAGRVRSGGQVLDKPGQATAADLPLEVEPPPRFVSRGGEKLVAALDALPIRVSGRVCLDGGISTGGFSDCLLQRGASRVYGIDVGYGQTAWSLRTDPRLVLRERTNLRHLSPDDLYGPGDPRPDLAVADLSFISLGLVLPALGALLAPGRREALVLVKPQFEVGRARVGKGGVVRDPAAHLDAIEGVIRSAAPLGWAAWGLVASPITGPAGNHEYLLWLGSEGASQGPGESGDPIAGLSSLEDSPPVPGTDLRQGPGPGLASPPLASQSPLAAASPGLGEIAIPGPGPSVEHQPGAEAGPSPDHGACSGSGLAQQPAVLRSALVAQGASGLDRGLIRALVAQTLANP